VGEGAKRTRGAPASGDGTRDDATSGDATSGGEAWVMVAL
jgi:hypothetical protein